MKLFLDTEFTGLNQNTTLISLGIISEDNQTFYAEFGDFDYTQVNDWLIDNVISNLKFHNYFHDNGFKKGWCNCSTIENKTEVYGNTWYITENLKWWLQQFDDCKIWSDCLSYDWVLFCQLFQGALNLPSNIYYIPFDISTLFELKGIDPDINREKFAMVNNKDKHNALCDAIVIKKCYEKLLIKEV